MAPPLARLSAALAAAIIATSCAAQYYEIKANAPPPPIYTNTFAVGDFNNNGFPDLVTFHVVLDPAVNGILTPVTVPLPQPGFYTCSAGNIDGDANLDLLGTPSIFLGQGNGAFSSQPFPIQFPGPVERVHLADLNQDGLDDAILQIRDATTVHLQAFMNGFPQWTPGWMIHLPYIPIWSTPFAGDFNGDGNPDLSWSPHPLLYPSGSNTPAWMLSQIYVVFGDGAGGFSAVTAYSFGAPGAPLVSQPWPTVVDLDGDGRSDILMPSGGVPEVRIYFGNSSSGLEPATFVPWPANLGGLSSSNNPLWQLFAYDIDVDGDIDMVKTGTLGPFAPMPSYPPSYPMAIDVLNGTGYRSWAGPWVRRDLTIPPLAGAWFTPADYDLDGDVDLIGVPSTVPNALYLENTALFGTGCSGTAGSLPISAQGDLTLGDSGYFVLVHGALPFVPAVFAVSLNKTPTAGCGIYVDSSPGQLLLPTPAFGFTTTNALGSALLNIPLPGGTILAGTAVFSQWFVGDPAGALSAGGATYAASQGRTLVLW